MSFNKLYINKLYYGDCKEILSNITQKNSFDFIYIDPPFFSNKTYEVIWNDGAEIRSFEDRWKGGVEYYTDWMGERISLIKDHLKETGIFALHCDWRASHYLKRKCDIIFDYKNFICELYWSFMSGGFNRKCWSPKVNNILLYGKSKNWKINLDEIRVPYDKKTIERSNYILAGKKRELHPKGRLPDNIISIPALRQNSNERVGYPTQKPIELLEYLIKACSNRGELIGDFFCGGGTTLLAAQNLNRNFVGIDVSPKACMVSCNRLRIKNYNIINYPYTKERIMKLTGIEFQSWVIQKLYGHDHGVDKNGIDGHIPIYKGYDNVGVQVKNHKVDRKDANHFIRSIKNSGYNKKKAIIVGLSKNNNSSFSKGVYDEKALAKEEGLDIDLIEANIWLEDDKKIEEYIENNKNIRSNKLKLIKERETSIIEFMRR